MGRNANVQIFRVAQNLGVAQGKGVQSVTGPGPTRTDLIFWITTGYSGEGQDVRSR